MRTVLVSTVALMVGFVLSAVAQNAPTQQNAPVQENAQAQQNAQAQSPGCGQNAMSPKTHQGVTNSGFTEVHDVPKAIVLHALDPDGNPVIMVVAPAQ